jgi:phenylpropionate dioxygenase-like ring-hydroxylating dioxygenase large terminal subunit
MNYYLFILFLNLLFNYSFAFTPNILFNNWNCIGIKENINFNKPYTIKVGDLPLVIWKNKDNQVVSAINICKHLGSSFDDGSISNDGCLVCPYHGLKYNSQDEFGKVIEQDGKLFWSHNPKNNKPPSFPMYNNKKYKKTFLEFEMECSLQDSAYNSLDIRHPAFVHNSIIGFGNNNPPKNIKTYNYKNKDMIGLFFIYKSNKIIQYINSN